MAAGAGFSLTFSFPLAMMVERKENINRVIKNMSPLTEAGLWHLF